MNQHDLEQMAQFTIQHTKDGISKVYKDGVLTHTFPATDEFTIQHWYYDEYGVIEPTEYEGGTTVPGEDECEHENKSYQEETDEQIAKRMWFEKESE